MRERGKWIYCLVELARPEFCLPLQLDLLQDLQGQPEGQLPQQAHAAAPALDYL